MHPLVHLEPPFGAIGHIVDDTIVSDPFGCTVLAVVLEKFESSDFSVVWFHEPNYINNLPINSGD